MLWKCLFIILVTFLNKSNGIKWNQLRCSKDTDENVSEGTVENIGRFPWMGLVMHKFYLGGQMRTVMTGGVLIHPHYALAPAEDITKIDVDLLINTTTFMMYRSKESRYTLRVTDYAIHPEFFAKTTFATLAILELFTSGETGVGENKVPILPICLPFQGIGTYEDLNVVKFTDSKGDVQKSLYKMKFVPETDCEEFYNQSNLNFKQKFPPNPICAETIKRESPCVWEGGYLLISRQNWGFWKLLGFGMRGPGCGVPSKFVDISRYMSWIDFMVSPRKPDEVWGKRLLYIRRQSPTELTMYPADIKVPVNQGQCDDNQRGNVIFKDNSEVLMTKNFGQGFYILSIHQAAEFSCAKVYLESMSRTNALLWLEHNCVNDITGMRMPDKYKNQRLECFIYFKTSAYLEFRFQFSFRALIEVTLFGKVEHVKRLPNPFHATEVTFPWYPTEKYIRRRWFVSYQQYWYNP